MIKVLYRMIKVLMRLMLPSRDWGLVLRTSAVVCPSDAPNSSKKQADEPQHPQQMRYLRTRGADAALAISPSLGGPKRNARSQRKMARARRPSARTSISGFSMVMSLMITWDSRARD